MARGDAEAGSNVDLVAELDPTARIGMFTLAGLEQRLAQIVSRPVDLPPEPVEKPRLRASIERDRVRVFWSTSSFVVPLPRGLIVRTAWVQ